MKVIALSLVAGAALAACGGGDAPVVLANAAQQKIDSGERLDANYVDTANGYRLIQRHDAYAQQFVVQASGRITRFSVNLCNDSLPAGGQLTLSISRGNTYNDWANAISRFTMPLTALPLCSATNQLVEVDVDGDGNPAPTVEAGETLMIAATTDQTFGPTKWLGSSPVTADQLPAVKFGDGQATLQNLTLFYRTYVTPPQWSFSGFLEPVNPLPTLNTSQAGRAIPVKFSFGEDKGFDIFESAPSAVLVNCDGSAATDAIELTISSAGESGLQYDATTMTYTYVWKTEKAWANSCRQLALRFRDGSTHKANFDFDK